MDIQLAAVIAILWAVFVLLRSAQDRGNKKWMSDAQIDIKLPAQSGAQHG
jgi:hypothetical protein